MYLGRVGVQVRVRVEVAADAIIQDALLCHLRESVVYFVHARARGEHDDRLACHGEVLLFVGDLEHVEREVDRLEQVATRGIGDRLRRLRRLVTAAAAAAAAAAPRRRGGCASVVPAERVAVELGVLGLELDLG